MRNRKTAHSPAAFPVAQMVTSQELMAMFEFVKNFKLKYARKREEISRKKK